MYYAKTLLFVFISSAFFTTCKQKSQTTNSEDPVLLLEEMMVALGRKDLFYAQKDVSFTYTFRDLSDGKTDVSREHYLFDGERSKGIYSKRDKYAFPELEGKLAQIYNGKHTAVKLNDSILTDSAYIKSATFTRKANYYWFTMMFKLLDAGCPVKYLEEKTYRGQDYHIIELTFDHSAKDKFILYLNKVTRQIDYFLFTISYYGMYAPLLMEVQYEEIDGFKLPTHRRSIKSDWDGNTTGKYLAEEITTNIKFRNGFTKADFDLPKSAQ